MAFQVNPPSGAFQAQSPYPASGQLHPAPGNAPYSSQPWKHRFKDLSFAGHCLKGKQTGEYPTFPRPITSSILPGVPHSRLHPLESSLSWYPVLTPPYTTTGRTHVLLKKKLKLHAECTLIFDNQKHFWEQNNNFWICVAIKQPLKKCHYNTSNILICKVVLQLGR